MPVHRAVYRKLMKDACRVDADPALRALITIPHRYTKRYDRRIERWVEWGRDSEDPEVTSAPLVNMLKEINADKQFYAPCSHSKAKISSSIRQAFRSSPLNLSAAFGGLKILNSIVHASPELNAIALPESVPKALESIEVLPQLQPLAVSYATKASNEGPPSPTANTRAQFLISHPLLDEFFKHTIILVSAHQDETESQESASMGWIINAPVEHRRTGQPLRVSEISLTHPVFQENLKNNIVFRGGPVSALTVFYAGPPIRESVEIVSGIHNSRDLDTLHAALKDGTITADRVMVVVGYSGWGSGQLRGEIAQGSWFLAGLSGEENITSAVLSSQRALTGDVPYRTPNQCRTSQWTDVLCAMGGEYRAIARLSKVRASSDQGEGGSFLTEENDPDEV